MTAYRLGAAGYEVVFDGDDVYRAEWPWLATIDLPRMTAERDRMFGPPAI